MLFKSISDNVRITQLEFGKHSKVKRLVFGSFLSCVAAVLQSAGGLLPGIGYFISPFATLPILISAMFSFKMGVVSYLLTIPLLFILYPSELFIFPFTTGLIGISIGSAFSFFKKRLSIIFAGTISLTIGIIGLLYIFHFPLLGPAVSDSFSFLTTGLIFIFSFLYSYLWVEIALFFFKKFKNIIT